MEMSKRIKDLRLQNKMTQEELGKVIGVQKSAIMKYESGAVKNIKRSNIKKLATALNVTPMYLLGFDDSIKPYDIKNIFAIDTQRIPLLGRIAAGVPQLADENFESCVEAGANIKADFCLRVHGDSMINARIFDGDIVFIKKQADVNDGEIAAVLIDEEATLKRVYKMPGRIQLRAENPKYAPIDYTENDGCNVIILGKAIAFQGDIS